MKKEIGSVTFKNSIEDTFPYIESATIILDNNLPWWKKNYEDLEKEIANATSKFSSRSVDVLTKLIIYNGPDESVESVTWSSPAIEFTFIEAPSTLPKDIKKELEDTWNDHKLIASDNKLIILFE
jgi:hypothetical protein